MKFREKISSAAKASEASSEESKSIATLVLALEARDVSTGECPYCSMSYNLFPPRPKASRPSEYLTHFFELFRSKKRIGTPALASEYYWKQMLDRYDIKNLGVAGTTGTGVHGLRPLKKEDDMSEASKLFVNTWKRRSRVVDQSFITDIKKANHVEWLNLIASNMKFYKKNKDGLQIYERYRNELQTELDAVYEENPSAKAADISEEEKVGCLQNTACFLGIK